MEKQLTASEVRELAATIWPDLSGREEVAEALNAFADLLEAREKSMPVVTRESAINAIEHVGRHNGPGRETEARQMLVEGPSSVAHRAPSDAERLAEALRMCMDIMLEHGVPTHPDANARVAYTAAEEALSAHSAQTQPPATSVPDTLAVFEVVSGVEGPCLTISRKADGKPRHEYRLAGPKPWGGGNTTHSFKVHTRELREQIDAIEAALAAQENHNG